MTHATWDILANRHKKRTLTVFRFFQINGRQDGSSRGRGSTVPLQSIYKHPHSWKNSHRRERCTFDVNDWCTEYVVCSKCHSIYEFDNCVYTTASGCKESKKCCHVEMPEHPHQRQRTECGFLLLKKQHTKKGYRLVPHKVHPYRPLKRSITKLMNKRQFISQCQKWEEINSITFFCDIIL